MVVVEDAEKVANILNVRILSTEVFESHPRGRGLREDFQNCNPEICRYGLLKKDFRSLSFTLEFLRKSFSIMSPSTLYTNLIRHIPKNYFAFLCTVPQLKVIF